MKRKTTEVGREKISKLLEYAAGFFLFFCLAMSFSRWLQGVDFYPRWLIGLFFVLFLVAFVWHRKLRTAEIVPEMVVQPTAKAKENRMSWEEVSKLEREAHDLIVKLCASKNIGLYLKQEGRSSGHCEIPEIWTLEKAVPLTPDDLYAIIANEYLKAETKVRDDGIVYAEKFTMSSSWIIYEQEK